jgi:8-hydroxy-5-deazaflavin:NADPH oxidoreductase
MNLAILGGTNLATALGNKFIARGINVEFGVRDGFNTRQVAWKILKMQKQNLLSFKEAINKADVIFLCCDNEFLDPICKYLKDTSTHSKMIVDCTNGQWDPDLGCNTTYIINSTNHPRVYKAFNNLGLDYPKSDPLTLVKETYFCGDGIEDRFLLKRLIELIGFKAIDAGKLKNARLLEAVYHLRREIALVRNGEGDLHFTLMSM